MKRYAFSISDFICQECGFSFPLPRKKVRTREKGHIKDLYCAKCKRVTKFKEIRECDLIDEDTFVFDTITG